MTNLHGRLTILLFPKTLVELFVRKMLRWRVDKEFTCNRFLTTCNALQPCCCCSCRPCLPRLQPQPTKGDAETLDKLLRRNAEDTDYNIAARRRIVEYALHQRAHSKQFFEQQDPAYAAAMLRRNSYADRDFYPWSAWMLAKLYLGGVGVPQDEGEALYLVELCQQRVRQHFMDTLPDTMACRVLRARMQRNGWAGPPDEAAAQATLAQARTLFRSATQRELSDVQLLALFR